MDGYERGEDEDDEGVSCGAQVRVRSESERASPISVHHTSEKNKHGSSTSTTSLHAEPFATTRSTSLPLTPPSRTSNDTHDVNADDSGPPTSALYPRPTPTTQRRTLYGSHGTQRC
jgi:hypothetical protein